MSSVPAAISPVDEEDRERIGAGAESTVGLLLGARRSWRVMQRDCPAVRSVSGVSDERRESDVDMLPVD